MLQEYARRDAQFAGCGWRRTAGSPAIRRRPWKWLPATTYALLDHDDTLAPFALFEVVRALNQDPAPDFIYSDEDHLNEKGRREHPHFKPDWSPDTLRSHNYICHLVVIRRDLLERVGGLARALTVRRTTTSLCGRRSKRRRSIIFPRSSTIGDNIPRRCRADQEGTRRTKRPRRPFANTSPGRQSRARLPTARFPAPITSSGPCSTGRWCRSSSRRKTRSTCWRQLPGFDRGSTYPSYEILLIENQSRRPETLAYYRTLEKRREIRLVPWNERFNYSRLNNFAAARPAARCCCF